ncbi:NlpC/P60 family protein [Oceanospirillum sp. HFRX-1_2]
MKQMFFPAIIFLLAGCGESDQPDGVPFEGYQTVELTTEEKQLVISQVQSAIGQPYLWGGQSMTEGFDCSGLLVWAYQQSNLLGWKWKDRLVTDATAQTMHDDNSTGSTYLTLNDMKAGDWIFFDADYNGTLEHMSIYSHTDDQGIWVWDAYSIKGEVALRVVDNFQAKNPYFSKPMKVIKQ